MVVRAGIFGGSFDPPHLCHLLLAVSAIEAGWVDEVWWIPLLNHAFGIKAPSPFADRAQMVERMISPYHPRMRWEDIEASRRGPSYTIDTVRDLQARHPGVEFVLLAGSDILAEFHRWKDHEELLQRVPLRIVGRLGEESLGQMGFHSRIQLLPIALPQVSSSSLRQRLRQGLPGEPLIPPRVAEYIRARGLYREEEAEEDEAGGVPQGKGGDS